MNNKPEMFAFVKAMASAERLRIVGVLCQGAKRANEIAEALGIHPSDVMMHLEQLSASGAVHEADRVYQSEDNDIRKVLKKYLKADGMLKQIPPMGDKLSIILKFIVDVFDFDANYTEKEINTVLRRFHLDTALLRRYLVDYGLLARDGYGTKYWRKKQVTE
ncbi:MAG TPA: DUF2087 domain-containing protein [Anaerolineales bacterium]|nr:DUF2087 domain-containing protein [Anaerolineales bacterium]